MKFMFARAFRLLQALLVSVCHHRNTFGGSCLQAECWRSGYGWQWTNKSDPCRFWSGDIRCFLAALKSFRRWNGWCHCYYYKLQIKGFRTYPPAGRVIKLIKGSWPLLFMSASLNGHGLFFGVGSSWGLEDWILSGQVACTYKVFEDLRSVFWEVWRNRSVFCNTWYL